MPLSSPGNTMSHGKMKLGLLFFSSICDILKGDCRELAASGVWPSLPGSLFKSGLGGGL
jgi:hypothetical protein